MKAAILASKTLSLPDVRMDKVAIVQSALANSSYCVRASEIALKVMDSMLPSMKSMD